jgi:hypothetical protein
VWDLYARIERSRGRIKEARNVYVQMLVTLNQQKGREGVRSEMLKSEELEIWRSWSEMEWEEEGGMGKSVALRILVEGVGCGDGKIGKRIYSLS